MEHKCEFNLSVGKDTMDFFYIFDTRYIEKIVKYTLFDLKLFKQ